MKKTLKNNSQISPISCEWKKPSISQEHPNKDRVFRYKGNFRWSGVKTERYKEKDGGWSAIARNVLIGSQGESAKFHLRYFEIEPGGFSSLEMHKHEHVVICVRGRGKVRMGKKSYVLNHLDTVYMAPDTIHQLKNPYNEPFGFFCIVNAKRDKPKTLMTDQRPA